MQVSGQGFNAGEQIDITFQAQSCARVAADSRGRFAEAHCSVPAELRSFPGATFYISAAGHSSTKSDEQPFTLTAEDEP